MLIRKKIALAIIVLVLILGLAILASMQMVLIPTRDRIESMDAEKNVLNVVRVIQFELDTMQGTSLDWSRWDDTYFFAQDRSQEYIENNLMNETFTSLKLDFMLYYDVNGTLFFGKGYDYIEHQPLVIPELLNSAEPFLKQIRDIPEEDYPGVQGILTLPEGTLLVSVNPILKSDHTGPVSGYLCVARYLDDIEIQKIAQLTSTNLSISGADERNALNSLLDREHPVFVEISEDNNYISSYALIRDVFGMPAVVMRVDSERVTYQASQKSMILFILIIAGIGFIAVFAVLFLLDRDIFSRLSYLGGKMKEIAESRDFSKRIVSSGNDEISSLSSGINHTLNSLEGHIISEREAVLSSQIANKKLILLSKITSHDILNQVTVIRSYAELSREGLSHDSSVCHYLDRITEASISIEDQLAFTKEYHIGGEHSAPTWFRVSDLIRRITLKVALGPVKVEEECGDLEIFSDPLIERIIYNLIDNSIAHGERVTRIKFHFRQEGEVGVLTCEDDGIGISFEDKAHIFEKGFGKHRGLGLFLTKGILAITGITIQENGIPGKGARFEMQIPPGWYRISGDGDDAALE